MILLTPMGLVGIILCAYFAGFLTSRLCAPRQRAASTTVEGVCLPIYGYEEDYLKFVDTPDGVRHLGITSFVEQAGAHATEWSVEHAFETEGSDWDRGHAEDRAAYRAETGRTYPPLYRVRLQTTVEPMPEPYVATYWAKERATYAAIPRTQRPEQEA